MTILSLDVECSQKPYHLPWLADSYLSTVCCISYDTKTKEKHIYNFIFNHSENEYNSEDINKNIIDIHNLIDNAFILVGHNIKFDLHWLNKLNIKFDNKKLWCTQVAEYIINGQDKTCPLSLHELSLKYGLTPKIDKVKMYWESGYNTYDIPLNILIPYGEQDTINALNICLKQWKKINASNKNLFCLHMEFIKILRQIEFNGMKIDTTKIKMAIPDYTNKLTDIKEQLISIVVTAFPEIEDILEQINFNSDQHLSAILYGGEIKYDGIEIYYKDYKNKGKIEKQRKTKLGLMLSGLGFIPPKGTETKKEGVYKTDKGTLDTLKCKTKIQKQFLFLLKEYSKIEKIKSTYLEGLLEREKDSYVHPNMNQTVTTTGRLSCTNPNLQNQPRSGTDKIIKDVFISRFI